MQYTKALLKANKLSEAKKRTTHTSSAHSDPPVFNINPKKVITQLFPAQSFFPFLVVPSGL